MVNPKWGTKRQCQECGAQFYDLKRAKIICPKCDTPFKADPPPKARRVITPAAKEEAAPVAAETIAAETVAAEPVAAETVAAEPVAAEPVAAQAPAAEAPAAGLEENAGGAEESAEDKVLKELAVEIPGDDAAEADEEKEEEAAFEDVSELGEDKDDMAEVIEGSRAADET